MNRKSHFWSSGTTQPSAIHVLLFLQGGRDLSETSAAKVFSGLDFDFSYKVAVNGRNLKKVSNSLHGASSVHPNYIFVYVCVCMCVCVLCVCSCFRRHSHLDK